MCFRIIKFQLVLLIYALGVNLTALKIYDWEVLRGRFRSSAGLRTHDYVALILNFNMVTTIQSAFSFIFFLFRFLKCEQGWRGTFSHRIFWKFASWKTRLDGTTCDLKDATCGLKNVNMRPLVKLVFWSKAGVKIITETVSLNAWTSLIIHSR